MANSNRFIGPYNSFPPQAQGQLVGFMRERDEFKINEYVQNIEADDPVGFFFSIQPDQSVRMVNKAEWAWEPGSKRPTGNHNLSMFSTTDFACFPWSIPYTLPLQTVLQARRRGGFDPEVVEAKSCVNQMMTMRTQDIIQLAQVAANWNGNTSDANVLNGGRGLWSQASDDEASPYYLAIKRSLEAAWLVIALLTNGRVKPKDLCLILSPGDAQAISATSEVHNYIKYLASVQMLTKGGLADINTQYGMPDNLYGVKVIVEDSPQVTVYQNADGTTASVPLGERSFVKSNGSAILCSRVGGIDAPFGTRSFSTLQFFWHQFDMVAESRQDSWNRIVEGTVTSQYVPKIAAPASGYLITNIT